MQTSYLPGRHLKHRWNKSATVIVLVQLHTYVEFVRFKGEKREDLHPSFAVGYSLMDLLHLGFHHVLRGPTKIRHKVGPQQPVLQFQENSFKALLVVHFLLEVGSHCDFW